MNSYLATCLLVVIVVIQTQGSDADVNCMSDWVDLGSFRSSESVEISNNYYGAKNYPTSGFAIDISDSSTFFDKDYSVSVTCGALSKDFGNFHGGMSGTAVGSNFDCLSFTVSITCENTFLSCYDLSAKVSIMKNCGNNCVNPCSERSKRPLKPRKHRDCKQIDKHTVSYS